MTNRHTPNFQILENCASVPLQGHEEDWKELMQILKLSTVYLESVQLVLGQGRWRKATDPVGYVRAAARREFRKLEIPRKSGPFAGSISELNLPHNEDGTPMEHDQAIDYLQSRWPEDDDETPYVERRVRPELWVGDSPDEDARMKVNYSMLMDQVASLAGLSKARRDEIETVLVLRATLHLTRDQILLGPDATQRKRRQAAWRWIDRHKALLKKLLSGR